MMMARTQKPGEYGKGSVYQRADGKWVGAFMGGFNLKGTRRRHTVTARTEKECRAKLLRKQGQIARDGEPDPGLASRSTVKGWADRWMELRTPELRPKTVTAYRSSINRAIVPTIGHRKLVALTPDDVRAVARAITSTGGSSTNARHAHRVLLHMLKGASLEGHSVPQRVLLTSAPPAATNDRTNIPIDQSKALLRTALGELDASRWIAALLGGLRQGECLGLRWEFVDLDQGLIDVSWQLQRLTYADRTAGTFRTPPGYQSIQLHKGLHLVRPKTAAGQRIIPIVEPFRVALEKWRTVGVESPHDLVWPSLETGPRKPPGRPRDPSEDTAAWNALQERAGISKEGTDGPKPWLLHEARHAAATLLLEGGVDPKTVQAIMGHASITTSRLYQHVSTDLARKALEGSALRLGL